MPKRIALKDKVLVDTSDLSNFARAVSFSSEHEQVDVSGFSSTGVNEYLSGPTTQSVTVTFFGSYGTGEVHNTLYPIHKNRTSVAFAWRIDQTASVSTTNPELRGTVQLFSYGPGVTRGDVDTFDATFVNTDSTGLA